MFAGITKNDTTRTRSLLVALALFSWMLLIVWRLVWVQIIKHDELAKRADQHQGRVVKVAAPRGEIVDRRGNPLAMTQQTDSLFADLAMLRKAKDKDRLRIVNTLAPLLGFSPQDFQNKLQASMANPKEDVLWLKRQMAPAFAQEARKLVQKTRLGGIGFARESHRHYPNETLSAHVVGAVSRGEKEEGLEGLEKKFQKDLTGLDGKVELTQDAKGNAYERFDTPPRQGARIVTTIDLALQHKVEVLLAEALNQTQAKSATAIVLDPTNGEVLSLANAPAFNPNERLRELTEQNAFLRKNRALVDMYEPGSVFKLVAYAGALEEGLIHPTSMIDCQGGLLRIPGRLKPVHDSHLGTGVVTAADAFAKSSNVGAVKMGMQLGKDRLLDYVRKFGFLNVTGIELPESRGSILSDDQWKYGAMGVVPIGQGVTVTALQAVAAFAAIANGGVWSQPHLVKEVEDSNGKKATPLNQRRVVREQTAQQLAQMMRHVVGTGTGKAAGQLAAYTAAGKTGTAQKASGKNGYGDNKFIASFVGFVPATQPRFAIIVVLDEPRGAHQGGQVCAPIFNLIAEAALIDSAVAPDDETFRATLAQMANKAAAEATPAPSSAALPVPAQMAKATPAALVSSKPSNDANGAKQNAARPHVIAGLSMPDLQGKGMRAAVQACTRLGMRMQFDGAGQVAHQYPAPGAQVKPGDLCKVKFQ